jgi:chemotaxis protein histidine kinase CheA
MPTLSQYFEAETRDLLGQLQRELQSTAPDTSLLHRAARAVRGTAQMARADRMLRAAVAFEAVLRDLAGERVAWSAEFAQRARDSVEDLFDMLSCSQDDPAQDDLLARILDRWRDTASAVMEATAETRPDMAEFRLFAAREIDAIATALDDALHQLAATPMDREPLKVVLRRQRALLGSARLDSIPVVAEILRAVDDLTRVVAKLDVGVKQEWFDIYRVARDGLRAAVEPLERDEDPPASHAVSRLRHIRNELLERYGAAESAPFQDPADDPAVGDEEVLELSDDEIVAYGAAPGFDEPAAAASAEPVAIDQFLYDRDAALHRALELRPLIERAVTDDAQAREAADELFDLIAIALQ